MQQTILMKEWILLTETIFLSRDYSSFCIESSLQEFLDQLFERDDCKYLMEK